MKTKLVKIISLIVLFLNLSVFAQSKYEAPTLSAGLDNIAFNKGTLDVQLLTEIIKEKQKELIAEGVKRFLIDNIIKADDFYTQFYLERIISILFEEKNHQVMTKKILEETTNYLFIIGTTEFVLNSDEIGKHLGFLNIKDSDIKKSDQKSVLSNLEKDKKERVIYLIYYICKDIPIIKKLGFLNNFNYFELTAKSKNKDFEAIRVAIDYMNSFKGKNISEVLNNLKLKDYNKINSLFEMFNFSIFKDSKNEKDFQKFIKNIDNQINTFSKIKKDISNIQNLDVSNINLIKPNYFELKKILLKYKVTLLNKNDETKFLNLFNDVSTNLDSFKTYKEIIDENIKNFKENIFSTDNLLSLINKKNYDIIETQLNTYNIQLLDKKTKNQLFKYINDFDSIKNEIEKLKVIFNKGNFNLNTLIDFIESLLSNQDILKDIIDITGLNKPKKQNSKTTLDTYSKEIIKKYNKNFSEYKVADLLKINGFNKDSLVDKQNNTLDKMSLKINKINAELNLLKKGNEDFIKIDNMLKNISLKNITEDNRKLFSVYKDHVKKALYILNSLNNSKEIVEEIEVNLNYLYFNSIGTNEKYKGLRINNLESNSSVKVSMTNYISFLSNFNNTTKDNISKNVNNLVKIFNLYESVVGIKSLNEFEISHNNNIKVIDSLKESIIRTNTNISKRSLINITETQKIIDTISNVEIKNKLISLATLQNKSKYLHNYFKNLKSKNNYVQNNNDLDIIIKNIEENKTLDLEVLTTNIILAINTKKQSLNEITNHINFYNKNDFNQIYKNINSDLQKLRNDIIIYYLKGSDAKLFEVIRKAMKDSLNINFKLLDSTDLKALKKFNRIILQRNLLDHVNGLQLVKELNDDLMADLNMINLKLKDPKNDKKDENNTFSKIIRTTEFTLSVLIKKQVAELTTDNKINNKLKNVSLKKFLGFIKFIGNIKELNKAETFSFLLKTMSNYKELFNLKDDNSLVDIVNSIRTYSIINNEKNVIEIDAASVLIHFTEKYINSDKNRFQFYATVGVNQSYMPNFKSAGLTSSSFSSASEKIGLKFNFADYTKGNYKETQLIHQVKRKPFVSNIYGMVYASGILYKVASTTDNGFESPNFGLATGLSFFNSLDFNISIAVPMEGKVFKNHFFGFSFDIPLSEYLSRL